MLPDSLKLPTVRCAAICEKVLIEKDEAISVIRIFDRVGIEFLEAVAGSQAVALVECSLLLSLFKGQAEGKAHTVGLHIRAPSGGMLGQRQTYPVAFPDEADEAAANITIRLRVAISESGVYWFQITFDDAPITQIPLRAEITARETRT
jgi:hypothetical protein